MFRSLFIAFLLLCWGGTSAYAVPRAYALQHDKSEVGFVFMLNGLTNRGVMPVRSADIVIDLDRFENSRVDVTIDAARARTGLSFATDALKSVSVLDVAAHPTIRFQSIAVRMANPRNLSEGGQIDGILTIKGISRRVTLDVALFRQRNTEEGDLSQLSFRINGALSRARFGVSGYPDLVDDTITLDIAARVRRIE
jgi:polyisoprenoid-binding protein YceI